MEHTVALAREELEGSAFPARLGGMPDTTEGLIRQAIYYYLEDRDADRAGWRYPRFRSQLDSDAETVTVSIDIDDSVWDAFAQEADRQRVSAGQLVRHAVIYFVADIDAGRVTERILDGRI
jgi:hypothetical protein